LTTEDTEITERKQVVPEAIDVIRRVRTHLVRLRLFSVSSVISVV